MRGGEAPARIKKIHYIYLGNLGNTRKKTFFFQEVFPNKKQYKCFKTNVQSSKSALNLLTSTNKIMWNSQNNKKLKSFIKENEEEKSLDISPNSLANTKENNNILKDN